MFVFHCECLFQLKFEQLFSNDKTTRERVALFHSILFSYRRIDDVHTNGNGKSAECVGTNVDSLEPNESHSTTAYNKRPVSMYETREGPHATKSQQNHDNRTANSMYQMVDGQAQQVDVGGVDYGTASTNGTTLPHSDEVKHRTEVVTRRIQELWSVMQEMTANDVFVPGAERIRIAVAELTAVFPTVSKDFVS